MTVVLLASDLFIGSRIAAAAESGGASFSQVSDPADLPAPGAVSLLLVAWDERRPDWGERIVKWCADAPLSAPLRVVLFGPHTDLEAHAAARAAGLGPMWARSKLVSELPSLLEGR